MDRVLRTIAAAGKSAVSRHILPIFSLITFGVEKGERETSYRLRWSQSRASFTGLPHMSRLLHIPIRRDQGGIGGRARTLLKGAGPLECQTGQFAHKPYQTRSAAQRTSASCLLCVCFNEKTNAASGLQVQHHPRSDWSENSRFIPLFLASC